MHDEDLRLIRDAVALLMAAEAILQEMGVQSASMTITLRSGEERDVDVSPSTYGRVGVKLNDLFHRHAPKVGHA